MGYSTSLYAVDVAELKAAVGSGDAGLLERVRAVVRQQEGREERVDPTKGPRALVTHRSEIYLDGKLVTPDEFKHALLDPKWAGTMLYHYQADPPDGEDRSGAFAELGSIVRFLMTLGPFFAEHGLVYAKRFVGIQGCSSEQALAAVGGPDDEITEDEALAELIAGKFRRKDCGHVYGYALQWLCLTVGSFLDVVGTDRLRALELKTPLSKTRSPVKLPRIEDFPYISHLDATALQAEVARLRGLDLSYPRDLEIENERRRFLHLLESAAGQGRGVVGFYH